MKDGILVVNKPEGLSSAAVVGKLKRLFKVKKIGHTGTLDPFATGVLLIAFGRATRISRFFLDGSKAYLAQVALGITTDTYDCTGQVLTQADDQVVAGISLAMIQAAAVGFSGPQEQVAPAFSALKHQGVPLYKLARQGKAVQKPPRPIEIYKICASNLRQEGMGPPVFDLEVHCSGGTYIRSLAHDLGMALGCGSHLSGLVRTRSSQFTLDQALDLDTLAQMSLSEVENAVVPMADCLNFLPGITADQALAKKVSQGQPLSRLEIMEKSGGDADFLCILDEFSRLLAVVAPAGQTYNYCCVFHY